MPTWKGFWATKQFDAIRKWDSSELPSWLNEKACRSWFCLTFRSSQSKQFAWRLMCLTLTQRAFGAEIGFHTKATVCHSQSSPG